MERREFIYQSCLAGLTLTGCGFLLDSCKTVGITESNGEISVPLKEFENTNTVIFKSSAHAERIIVVKEADNTFKAFLLKCTHKGAEIELKDGILVCPAHGSKFNLEGNVISIPAKNPLRSFPVEVLEKSLLIRGS